MSKILLYTRKVILDDDNGKSFTEGDILVSLTYKSGSEFNTLFDVHIRSVTTNSIHIDTDECFRKIKITDIISWS